MRILFDHCTPHGIARFLVGHQVSSARKLGWAELTNGKLLNAAEEAGFDVIVTVDQNIRYQQNLKGRKIALVVLRRGRWRLVQPVISTVIAAVNEASPGTYTEVPIPEI
jgi:predicted nuclease of predicted toxin-antitoxin system